MDTIRDKYEAILKPWLETEYEEWKHGTKKRILRDPKQMAERACDYFSLQEEMSLPFSTIGLILRVGFRNKSTWALYRTYEEYTELMQVLDLIMEDYYFTGLYGNYRASSFILRTKYGYQESIVQIVENREYKIDINEPTSKDND